MPTTTANLGLTLPTPNVDTGWGSTLNTDFTLIDNLFTADGTGTSVGINVGSGKTLGIGGTLLLGSGDGTGSVTAPTIRGAARTGTNVVGANLTFDAANGTGTGGSGSLIFRTAPTGVGGTTANSLVNSLVINNSGNVGIGTSSANQKLHIRSSGSVYAQIQCDNPAAGVGWYFSNTTKNWLIGSGPVSGGGEFAFYDATVGVERFRIDTSGNALVTSSGGLGYGTGSGGSITQLTSKSTGVTLNKTNGQVTMNAAALGAGAFVNFQVTNSTVTATDTVIANVGAGGFGGNYYVNVTFCTSGSFGLRVTNQSGVSLSEAVVINFAVIKAVTS